MCLPKWEGGLRIRAAKDMNKALIAKVGWRLINDKHKFWARVVRSKYKVGDMHHATWTAVVGLRRGEVWELVCVR